MARKETSPDTFAKLTNEISERYPSLSKRFQQIARYLTQNPNTVALQSVTHVAGEADIHVSSLVRFASIWDIRGSRRCKRSSRPG